MSSMIMPTAGAGKQKDESMVVPPGSQVVDPNLQRESAPLPEGVTYEEDYNNPEFIPESDLNGDAGKSNDGGSGNVPSSKDTDKSKGGGDNNTPKPDDTKDDNSDPKPENLKFEDFLKGETKANVEKPQQKYPEKRDLTGIPEEQQKLFKSMSNEAYSYFRPLYDEKMKAASGPKPEEKKPEEKPQPQAQTIYDHPEAYSITPEYKNLAKQAFHADRILEHWQQQAVNIKKTGKFRNISFDDKNNLIVGPEQDATDETEAQLAAHITKMAHQAIRANEKLDGFVNSYTSTYKNDESIVNGAINEFFGEFTKPDHPTAKLQQSVIDKIPARFRGNPVTRLTAVAIAALANEMNQRKLLQAEINKLKGVKSDAEKAQPTKQQIGSAGGSGPAPVKFSDFTRELNR